jgi:hypothetical protein
MAKKTKSNSKPMTKMTALQMRQKYHKKTVRAKNYNSAYGRRAGGHMFNANLWFL